MSESRTFVFPENGNSGGGTNGILAMLPALMQQRGVDPNILALMETATAVTATAGVTTCSPSCFCSS